MLLTRRPTLSQDQRWAVDVAKDVKNDPVDATEKVQTVVDAARPF